MDTVTKQLTLLVVTVLLGGDMVTSQSESVSVTFQVHPPNDIKEGMTQQMGFTCQVSGSFVHASDTLTIGRKRPGQLLVVLVSTTGKTLGAPDNVYFGGWALTSSGGVLSMLITPVNRTDAGEYRCQAARPVASDQFVNLDLQILAIDILFPASGPPLCEAIPTDEDFTWKYGTQITVRCTSDAGNPTATLQWYQNAMLLPGAQSQISSDKIISSVNITLDNSFNGIYLTCVRKNSVFISNTHGCRVGPLIVLESTDRPPLMTTESPLIPMTSLTVTEPTERVTFTAQIPTERSTFVTQVSIETTEKATLTSQVSIAPSTTSPKGSGTLDRRSSDRFGAGIGVGITVTLVLELIIVGVVFAAIFLRRRQTHESTEHELQPQNSVMDEKTGTSIYADLDQTERQASPYTELKPNVNHVF